MVGVPIADLVPFGSVIVGEPLRGNQALEKWGGGSPTGKTHEFTRAIAFSQRVYDLARPLFVRHGNSRFERSWSWQVILWPANSGGVDVHQPACEESHTTRASGNGTALQALKRVLARQLVVMVPCG